MLSMRAWAVAPSQRSVPTTSMPVWPEGITMSPASMSGWSTDMAPS
jgi:hypothetical protein